MRIPYLQFAEVFAFPKAQRERCCRVCIFIASAILLLAPHLRAQTGTHSPGWVVISVDEYFSGVLPVRVDIPRAGNSYRFVRPLVMDEETKVTFAYKSK